MSSPTVLSLKVVRNEEGQRRFVVPHGVSLIGDSDGSCAEGRLFYGIHAGSLGSNRPYERPSPFCMCEETESPCLLFRDGRFFDSGLIEYYGSQSDGYHLVAGFTKTGWQMRSAEEGDRGPHWQLLAKWFEEGDVIVVAYYPHPNSLKK